MSSEQPSDKAPECPFCHSAITPGLEFCPECGKRQVPRRTTFMEGCSWALLALLGGPGAILAACCLGSYHQDSHNEYAGLVLWFGMVGAAAFCLALSVFFAVRYRLSSNKDEAWIYVLLTTAGVAGFVLSLWQVAHPRP